MKLSSKQKLFRVALMPLLKHTDSVGSLRVNWSKDGKSVKVGKVVIESVKDCLTIVKWWKDAQQYQDKAGQN